VLDQVSVPFFPRNRVELDLIRLLIDPEIPRSPTWRLQSWLAQEFQGHSIVWPSAPRRPDLLSTRARGALMGFGIAVSLGLVGSAMYRQSIFRSQMAPLVEVDRQVGSHLPSCRACSTTR
jgi:hypothetical protein